MNHFPIKRDVAIDKDEEIGDPPQVDQVLPSQKVGENKGRFSNQNCKCDPPVRDHIAN